MLKIVLLLNIFVVTMIRLKHLYKIKKTETFIILLMHESDKKVSEDKNYFYSIAVIILYYRI